MTAYVQQGWQGWPKIEPTWKRQAEYETAYNELLTALTTAVMKAAKHDTDALDYLMHKVTQAMCDAYQLAKSLHDEE